MQKVDIVIVGGGLVGASLALALQQGALRRNWRIVMIEPFAPGDSFQPSYDARSSALSYGTSQILEQLGVWSAIAPRAEPIIDIHISEQDRFGAARLSAADEQVPALGYVVENAWMGHCLWQALDHDLIKSCCPAQVTHLDAQETGYRLTLDDGSQMEADLVVLADGGRSNLREKLGIEVRQTPYHQTALIANVTPTLAHEGLAFERFTPRGPMALLPLSDERCALVWTRSTQEAQRLFELSDAAFLDALQETFGYRLGRFRKVGARHSYPLTLSLAAEQVRPHLAVLGNAAHALHPIAGQGFNLSLRDAQALAQRLLRSSASPGDFAVLQAYAREQRGDQDMTIGFSDRVTRLFSHDHAPMADIRHWGLLGFDLSMPLKHWFSRQAMGLGARP